MYSVRLSFASVNRAPLVNCCRCVLHSNLNTKLCDSKYRLRLRRIIIIKWINNMRITNTYSCDRTLCRPCHSQECVVESKQMTTIVIVIIIIISPTTTTQSRYARAVRNVDSLCVNPRLNVRRQTQVKALRWLSDHLVCIYLYLWVTSYVCPKITLHRNENKTDKGNFHLLCVNNKQQHTNVFFCVALFGVSSPNNWIIML